MSWWKTILTCLADVFVDRDAQIIAQQYQTLKWMDKLEKEYKKDRELLLPPKEGFEITLRIKDEDDVQGVLDFSRNLAAYRKTMFHEEGPKYYWSCCGLETEQHPQNLHLMYDGKS